MNAAMKQLSNKGSVRPTPKSDRWPFKEMGESRETSWEDLYANNVVRSFPSQSI
jgi:hypothetical protein